MRLLGAFVWLSLGAMGLVSSSQAVPTTNGLYARFVTSKGTFYCLLRYDLVPRTVGNFVSLTDGTKEWLDYSKAAVVQQPFYDGLIFHRVIAGGIIQGGSRNGLGNDDPGYRFKDEFHPTLRHDKAGILSMANSGTNSNTSQFFITLGPQPALDDHHAVFGEIVEGLNVVSDISNVPAFNQRPLIPVIITNVTILRIGAAASNFNATALSPPLPVPARKDSFMSIAGANLLLSWQYTTGHEYRICYSGNLSNWNGFYLGPNPFNARIMNDFQNTFRSQFFLTIQTPID